MSFDPPLQPFTRLLRSRSFRVDREAGTVSWSPPRHWERLALAALAIFFVLVAAIDLDLGPGEARLGLASGERPGPLGQVVGYWAPDLWPAEVLPSYLLAQLEPGGRPSSAVVRWPAALAGILAGWMLARATARVMGSSTGLLVGLCWFGSIALIDRSDVLGIDLIVGLATLAALKRLMSGGTGWIAGLWASLAFLSGGLPPLLVIALAVVVMGRNTARFSIRFLVPPMVTIIVWSVWTSVTVSPELCAGALGLPFTQKPAWYLGLEVLAIGLPFSPFALLGMAPSTRSGWSPDARTWMIGWFQAAVASLIAGSLVPGLGTPARAVLLAAIALGAAAGLDAAWKRVALPGGRPHVLHPVLDRDRGLALRHDLRHVHLDVVSRLLSRAGNRDGAPYPRCSGALLAGSCRAPRPDCRGHARARRGRVEVRVRVLLHP